MSGGIQRIMYYQIVNVIHHVLELVKSKAHFYPKHGLKQTLTFGPLHLNIIFSYHMSNIQNCYLIITNLSPIPRPKKEIKIFNDCFSNLRC